MSDASIKVMQLLDELEDILETASKVPFSDKAIVDSEEISQIISDIRLSMPKDIQQAQWVKDEQDRIINEAKAQGNRCSEEAGRISCGDGCNQERSRETCRCGNRRGGEPRTVHEAAFLRIHRQDVVRYAE